MHEPPFGSVPDLGVNWKMPTVVSSLSVDGSPIAHCSPSWSLLVSSISMAYGIFTALFRSTILDPNSMRGVETTRRGRRPAATIARIRLSSSAGSPVDPASETGSSNACFPTLTGRNASCSFRVTSSFSDSL